MGRWFAASITLGLLVLPAPAWSATCGISKMAEIPVTMTGRRAIVTVQINGRDARFILDSGAFFSTIARANAVQYGLPLQEVMHGQAKMRGIGGETSLQSTTVKQFGIAGQTLPGIGLAVGGSDIGYDGILGQSILGISDVEYDFPHGMARLTEGKNCRDANMAYWAGTKPVAQVPIEEMGPGQHRTIGTVTLNGVKMKALFDTGTGTTLLSLAAAKRIGLTPDSPDVKPAGLIFGIGQKGVQTWRTRLDSIDIGGEAIRKPWIQIIDQTFENHDLLIGMDFFLTHRIYVDNRGHRMFVTYEGGPVFGLDPKGAVDEHGTALDLTDKSGEPTDAAGYAQRGAVFASKRDLEHAIADFDKAVAMAPNDAHYVYQRAMARLANRQPLLGAADLDKAITLAPGDAEARLARARLRIGARDQAGAMEDIKAADAALPPTADARLMLAGLYDVVEAYEPALASYDQWLRSHPEDSGRGPALDGRCRSRALMNRDLDKALSDCDAALRMRPGNASFLDSRALVRLRRGEFDKAIADYDAVVAAQPRNGWALYCRSLAERRADKAAQADTDRAAALAINPKVGDRAKRYGLEG